MKRLFSAVLCVCLIAALILPSAASEPNFSDKSEIDNWEQVCMLYDLGLITGYSAGNFNPDGYITRAEAAKIVAIIMDADAGSAGTSDFSDMEGHWATAYVRYCTDHGLLSGFSDGSFQPDRNITARELTKLLLMAIGCDGADYVGTGWAAAVDADAEELGLYAGFDGRLDMEITRDNACLLIFNALNCYAVEEDESGTRAYVTDQLLNPVTVLEHRFGVVRYEEVIEANEYADLNDPGTHLEEGYTKIHGHREFAVSTDLTMLGRWMGIYVLGNEIIGIPYYSASEVYTTFSSVEEMEAAMEEAGYGFADDAVYYYNYAAADSSALDDLGEVAEITIIDHEGDREVDVVLAVSYSSATVLDGRELILVLDSDLETSSADAEDETASETEETAETVQAASEETDGEDTAVDAEKTEETVLDWTELDEELLITEDNLVSAPSRLQTGSQVWVVSVGGRYLIKEIEE